MPKSEAEEVTEGLAILEFYKIRDQRRRRRIA